MFSRKQNNDIVLAMFTKPTFLFDARDSLLEYLKGCFFEYKNY